MDIIKVQITVQHVSVVSDRYESEIICCDGTIKFDGDDRVYDFAYDEEAGLDFKVNPENLTEEGNTNLEDAIKKQASIIWNKTYVFVVEIKNN